MPMASSGAASATVPSPWSRERSRALVGQLNTLWSGNWIRQSGSQRIIGSFNNGAVRTALAQANGIQALDCSRQVIALCGDGGFNMLMGEFLTAVHHKLPINFQIPTLQLWRVPAAVTVLQPVNRVS
jgi:Thiamine pyrophosphate enzyme, C-terminal TPP binding domain